MTPVNRLRKCMVTQSQFDKEAKKWLDPHTSPGWLHGLFQYQDGDEMGVVAVVELEDGNVIESPVDRVRMLEWPE